MGKRQHLEKILKNFKNERLDEILNLNNEDVSKFVNNNKESVIAIAPLTEDEWKSYRVEISYFIKAQKNINYIKEENNDIYTQLSECNNQDEIINYLNNINGLPFKTSNNIARYTIKIIKDINASTQSSIDEPDGATEPPPKETLTLAKLEQLIKNIQNLFDQLIDSDDRKINEILTEKFSDKYILSPEVIDEFINEVIRKYPEHKISLKKEIDKIAIINKEHTDKINTLETELDDYKRRVLSIENDNKTLKKHLEDAHAKLQKYDSASLKKAEDDLFSFNINDLSCFINNSTTDIQVNIRKALMIKACEYVDALNLLKTKNILTTEQNLPSEIIQIILLELFHEKNLL